MYSSEVRPRANIARMRKESSTPSSRPSVPKIRSITGTEERRVSMRRIRRSAALPQGMEKK